MDKHAKIWEGQEPEDILSIFNEVKDFISHRELDIAVFDYLQRADEYIPHTKRIIDLSQSFDRCPRYSNIVPTVTPGAKFLLIDKDAQKARLLRSFEKMRMQGLDTSMLTEHSMKQVFK